MTTDTISKQSNTSIKAVMLWFLTLLFFSFSAHSVETVYVTDKLYLGLHAKPSSSSKRIKLMKSGVKLEVLEKSGRFKKVKTVSGAIGWAKSHLLLSEPTSALKLEKLQEKLAELEKKSFVASAMQKEFLQIESKLMTSQARNVELQLNMDDLKKEKNTVVPKPTSIINVKDSSILIIIGLLVLLLLIGAFLFGRYTFERKIRGEFNGYRVW